MLSDLKVLYHLIARPIRGSTHEQRLENFYGGQADAYDDFRKRLLHGREDLYSSLADKFRPQHHRVWVDFGGGTGTNLEFIGQSIEQFEAVYIVDLSKSLLEVARKRCERHGWKNVHAIHADATTWQPDGPVDIATFSYSLTMIPDWFAAIENAERMLNDVGRIGVVDFYVSRKFPNEGHPKHSWFTRSFIPIWFNSDCVYPSPDHLPFLQRKFDTLWVREARSKLPYVPFWRSPYYQFIGRKRTSAAASSDEAIPKANP